MFAELLLDWFDDHGRHDLPWHKPRTAYHVWVSEIMLQQTQVKTVIPYYQRFMQRFPDVRSLAEASQDEVLAYWSGLGYYARGRNLHRTAQEVMSHYGGRLPDDIEALNALPGIGRSTAAAILAQAFHQPQAILDGNVKRVLTRYFAIAGWPGRAEVEQALWTHAEHLIFSVPNHRYADYTQAQMDLGATVCTRRKPACQLCPVRATCQAALNEEVDRFPSPKPKKTLPIKQACFWMLFNPQGKIWLEMRPMKGIWGGLYSMPETDTEQPMQSAEQRFGRSIETLIEWPSLKHSFSHYHLIIKPVEVRLSDDLTRLNLGLEEPVANYEGSAQSAGGWFGLEDALELGLPTPIRQLITQMLE